MMTYLFAGTETGAETSNLIHFIHSTEKNFLVKPLNHMNKILNDWLMDVHGVKRCPTQGVSGRLDRLRMEPMKSPNMCVHFWTIPCPLFIGEFPNVNYIDSSTPHVYSFIHHLLTKSSQIIQISLSSIRVQFNHQVHLIFKPV